MFDCVVATASCLCDLLVRKSMFVNHALNECMLCSCKIRGHSIDCSWYSICSEASYFERVVGHGVSVLRSGSTIHAQDKWGPSGICENKCGKHTKPGTRSARLILPSHRSLGFFVSELSVLGISTPPSSSFMESCLPSEQHPGRDVLLCPYIQTLHRLSTFTSISSASPNRPC